MTILELFPLFASQHVKCQENPKEGLELSQKWNCGFSMTNIIWNGIGDTN